jgi:CRISPR-associated protein Csb1
MVGWDANKGINTGSRIDPLGIARAAGPVFRTKDDGWTSNPEFAEKVGGKPALFGLSKRKLVAFDETKDQDQGAPSKINHGNVTPDFAFARDRNGNIIKEEDGTLRIRGGFTVSRATQTTVLSLTTSRRLRFPLNGAADSNLDVDRKARTALAAMGLAAAVLAREEGADLRSRCQLFAQQDFVWELLDVPGKAPESFALDGAVAVKLFNDAVAEATAADLPCEGEIPLVPSEDLVALVRKSQELAMHQVEGDD